MSHNPLPCDGLVLDEHGQAVAYCPEPVAAEIDGNFFCLEHALQVLNDIKEHRQP